jgi:hypothetical protein
LPKQKFTPVTDSFRVTDNVANLTWYFSCARGQDPFPISTGSTLTTGDTTVHTHLDSALLSVDNGARAQFLADDGHIKDTMDVSRRVFRDSNSVFSTEMKWVPLRVTALIDSPAINRLWRFVDGANKKYDDHYVRLFRFFPDPSNAAKPANEKWLEYAVGRDSIFELKAGRLFWIKTRTTAHTPVRFEIGSGTTMSLHVNDTIMVAPNGWTDFALPRLFNMRIGDIFDLMNQLAPPYISGAILLLFQFYQWTDTLGSYQCEPFYIRGIPTLDSLSKVMSCSNNTGYTIYNPSGLEVALFIPPISAAMSTQLGKKAVQKKKTGDGWALKLVPKTDRGALLSSVFCGYDATGAAGSSSYPMPPSFGKLSVGVYDEQTGAMNGHRMLHELRNKGASYMLAFRNDTVCARSIGVKLERIAGFPAAMQTAVYDPSTGETKQLSGTDELTVSVDGQTTAYRWLFVGDATYVASAVKGLPAMKLAFEKVYPNPAHNLVRLRYSLPFALSRAEFTILDISGRTIWRTTIVERTPQGGSRECLWNATTVAGKRVSAGVFIVRMEAFDQKGKTVGSFNRRLTVLQ